MRHKTVATNCSTYDKAFQIAAGIVGTKRKDTWRGRVRIRFHKALKTYSVQVPVVEIDATPSFAIKTLKLDATKAIQAARQPGGVRVVDDNGKLRFRLSLPSTPLPE